MSIPITEAHRRYIDYHCFGNKLNTSIEMMAKIIHEYHDNLTEWQEEATDDNNEYKFDDSEFDDWKADGEEEAKDETGYENSTGDIVGQGAYVGLNNVIQVGGAVYGAIQGGKVFSQVKNLENFNGKGIAWQAVAVFLEAAFYKWIKKPNEEEKEACDVLKNEVLPEQQEILAQTQNEMEDMAEKIEEASDEAATENENANQTMITNKVEYDLYAAIRASLEAKVARGESLTAGEKALYKTASAGMVNAGEIIADTQESNHDTVGGIYDDIASYQEGYDLAAENMANTQGVTDYAEAFDTRTYKMCLTEKTSRLLLAGKGVIAGGICTAKAVVAGIAQLWKEVAKYTVGAVAGLWGASWAKEQAAEQSKWAGEIDEEIGLRESVQGFNTEVTENYEEGITVYEGAMSDIEGLEITVPTDVEPPTNMDISQPGPPKIAPNSKDKDKDQK